VAWFLLRQCQQVHQIQPHRSHLLDELATLVLDLFDALRYGPILGALVLLAGLVAIQVLGAPAT
jgi:hypothetical protein